MAATSLFPTSLSDANANVAAGAYTDIDDGIAGDSVTLDSVVDQWTGGAGTGSAFSFGLTNSPGDFDTFTSIQLQIRAQVTRATAGGDTTDYVIDISGTNAPADTITYSEADAGSGFITRNFTNSAVTPSAADIDGWTVRVYQNTYSKSKGPDDINFEIDEIELTLTYTTGPTPAVGTITLTLTPAGDPIGRGVLAGAIPVSLTPTGDPIGRGVLDGLATITVTPTGDLTAFRRMSGNIPVTLAPAGVLSAFGRLSGTIPVTVTPVGDPIGRGVLTGTLTVTLTPTGEATDVGGGGGLSAEEILLWLIRQPSVLMRM